MREREYGIDALRIFAMVMIVVHHVFVHGGVLSNLEWGRLAVSGSISSACLCIGGGELLCAHFRIHWSKGEA